VQDAAAGVPPPGSYFGLFPPPPAPRVGSDLASSTTYGSVPQRINSPRAPASGDPVLPLGGGMSGTNSKPISSSLATFTSGSDQAASTPQGFLGTLLEAARRGIVEGTAESLDSASTIARALGGQQGFLDRPSEGLPGGSQPPPGVDNVGQLLRLPLPEGWSNPNWWAAQAAFNGAKTYPSAALGLAGMGVGSAAEPGLGTAVGGGLGYGLGSLIQTLAPAYQRARAEGLDHEAAVDRALKETLIETGFGAALGGAPGVALFGKTLEGALKRPVSELLAQIFGIQPSLTIAQDATRHAVEGAPVTADDLISDYVNGLVSGATRGGAHDAFRRWHGSVWWDLPMLRGLKAERKLGQNLHEYYPVIDIHDPKTGAVTSIKSIDLRAPRYRELPNSVHTALRRHVNRLANFEGADFAGHVVPKGSITSRTLLIAAPKSQTAPQRSALQRTIEYGNQHGVTVKVVVLR
jgi:hypothetical protein